MLVADGKRTLPRSRTRRPHVFRCNITSAIQNSKSTEKVLVPKKYKSTIEAEDNESISGPPVEVGVAATTPEARLMIQLGSLLFISPNLSEYKENGTKIHYLGLCSATSL